jgi:rubrerythrin
MVTSYATKLAQLARDYCRAEEAVVSAFFDQKRSPKEHIRWLRAQAFKEYSAIKPILSALAKLYPDIDGVVDRHDFEELTEKLADETRHARLVMDLLEDLGGCKITSADLLWLPEDRKLAAIRARYSRTYATLLHGSGVIDTGEIKRTDEQIERAAITLTEGGGGALYNVCRKLKRNGVDGKIAAVFQQIFADELNHKGSGERSLVKIIRTKKDFLRTAHIISDISLQRLRMRNEQFGFPLSDQAIRALDASIRHSFSRPAARSPTGSKSYGGRH